MAQIVNFCGGIVIVLIAGSRRRLILGLEHGPRCDVLDAPAPSGFRPSVSEITMNAKLFSSLAAALILSATLTSPASARHLRRHVYVHHMPYGIDYSHNYGPGPFPGTYAYYDGPLGVSCRQSAAAYRGQDGRRHPCN